MKKILFFISLMFLSFYIFSQEEVKLKVGKTIIVNPNGTWKYKSEVSNNNSFIDSRDGHVYKTVTIGTQTWMAENLAYLPVPASDPTVGAEDSGNDGKPFYYVYDLAKYGVLYNWYAALTAAPAGWHLPSDADWTTLSTYLGDSIAGGKMKSTSGWYSPNTGATNSSCFSALPGGFRGYVGLDFAGSGGFWWSSTQGGTSGAWGGGLYSGGSSMGRGDDGKCYGFSVRCVRD